MRISPISISSQVAKPLALQFVLDPVMPEDPTEPPSTTPSPEDNSKPSTPIIGPGADPSILFPPVMPWAPIPIAPPKK